MATQFIKLYGECKWAKVHKPDDKYDTYCLDLFMDNPSWALFKKVGLQLKVKEAEEGKFATFRRPRIKLIKGQQQEFGPPKVTDALGRPLEALVGNGSKVAITIAVYDTMKGKGHRLEDVQVLELVEFNGGVMDAHDGMDEEPAPKPKAAAKKLDIEDEIPF